MAFQTSILRDGEWVSETVSLQAALRASSSTRVLAQTGQNQPPCGILSKTIVDSPIVHWILPVRLRSATQNDTAFIGDHYVQVCELVRDGHVREVARKSDFGSRIRGAVVLGGSIQHDLDEDEHRDIIKSDDQDILMSGVPEFSAKSLPQTLPPQMLALMLDTGDTIFLFLKNRPGYSPEVVLHRQPSPRNLAYLGYHLCVDPSSRYMAAASPEGILAVYELESMAVMNIQYAEDGTIQPVKSIRIRVIQSVIHRLEFLYPRPEDEHHVILLLVITRRERNSVDPVSRMVTYEWEVGNNLQDVFSEERPGNRLPKEHRMPSLIIPLRFNTAFFVVSQPDIGMVKNCLSGSPVFEVLETDTPAQTPLHHGSELPLWTSWSRPFRRKKYFEKTDIIYLAREDGAIIHVEIDAPELVPSVTNVGCLDSNINTAFTIAYDVFSDLLIIGGDSGPGGIWKLAPRTDLEQVSVLPNWSPVIDVTIAPWHPGRKLGSPGKLRATRGETGRLVQPDSIFSASGRGKKGNLTEWRWGIPGRLGLDIDTAEPVRRSWAFTLDGQAGTLYGLLSLPQSSMVLQFSEDFSQVNALEADSTSFDLASRTLHAGRLGGGAILQITERTICIVAASQRAHHTLENIIGAPDPVAEKAYCSGASIVVSTNDGMQSRLHSLRVKASSVCLHESWQVPGEVTCLSLFSVGGKDVVVSGLLVDRAPCISFHSLEGELLANKWIAEARDETGGGEDEPDDTAMCFEPLTSISVVYKGGNSVVFVAGTRCGHLLTIRLSNRDPLEISWTTEALGQAPVDVFAASVPFGDDVSALVCCDNHPMVLTDFSESDLRFKTKNVVWLTDSNDPSLATPPVHSIFALEKSLSNDADHISVMLLAGSKLLFADIWPHFTLVPRSVTLNGSPTRVIFSNAWKCLVVALLRDDKPTLAFIDRETGEDISTASDKDRNESAFISGLGHPGDRIYGLTEWLYIKDGKTFAFLLVTTKSGKLLIVSVEKMETQQQDGRSAKLVYWTRYKKAVADPIYSVVGDDDGIIFCADKTIYRDVLDTVEKRLRNVKHHVLDSPATSIHVSEGKIYALTTMHSLEVLDYVATNDKDMSLIHTDRVSRSTVHMMDIGNTGSQDNTSRPITLLSESRGGLAGIVVPHNQRHKEFAIVFETTLPTSVRRFAKARTRPLWLEAQRRPRYGVIPSDSNGSEALAVSLDGSLRHFTLVDLDLWRLLSLIQTLARKSTILHPTVTNWQHEPDAMKEDYGYAEEEVVLEPRMHPKQMHIDGDVLEKCLDRRILERVIGRGDGLDLFCEYLDGVESGKCTKDFRDEIWDSEEARLAAYFEVGYKILEYLVEPVL